MASVKKIETTVGNVRLTTDGNDDCEVAIIHSDGSDSSIVVDEADLIDAVLEYAHERGLRRMRKVKATGPKATKPRKQRQQKPTADEPPTDPFADTPAAANA